MISVSLGSWKIHDFEQKINNLSSEQKNGKLQQICTKSLKNVKRQETMRMFFFEIKNKRERGGREGRRARAAEREEGAKGQGRT